jgi:cytoskeletal protein CcmA (bactofilin family)
MEQTSTRWTPLGLRRSRSAPAPVGENPEPRVPEVPSTVVERDCALEGKLVSDRPVRIEGELRGSVKTSKTVFVSQTGTVEGAIEARSVEIRGAVVGDVAAVREVILCAGGKLHGDVETSSLVIERGAHFTGGTRMKLPQHSSRSVTVSLPPPHPGPIV